MRGSESESDQSFVLTQKNDIAQEGKKIKNKKRPNSYRAKSAFHSKLIETVEHPKTDRKFIRGGTCGITVPNYTPVREILARMEWNQ